MIVDVLLAVISTSALNITVILLSINSTAIPSQHLFPGVAWLSGIITL